MKLLPLLLILLALPGCRDVPKPPPEKPAMMTITAWAEWKDAWGKQHKSDEASVTLTRTQNKRPPE